MSTNNPGLDAKAAPAHEAYGATVPASSDVAKDRSTEFVDTTPVAPDQFNPAYTTTRREVWAYYAYYIGNNGLSLFNFAPTQFQNLLSQAADPQTQLLPFAGVERDVNSIVLLCNGISFAIQCVIFLILGSYADFGSWRKYILIGLSIVAYAVGFGWLGVHEPSKWQVAAGLYIVGLIGYQTTLAFWTAAFPALARNSTDLKEKAVQYTNGEITRDEYDEADSLKRSELSNVAFYVQSVGELFILAVIVGVMFGLRVNDSTENNTWGLSVLIAFASGVWFLVSIPWFVLEKKRPGLDPGMNIILAGLLQLWTAIRKIWRLRQSLIYLIGYFLLGDCLNTTVTVIATLQADLVSYNSLQQTYLLLVGIGAQAVGIYVFWWLQQRFRLHVKTMFNAVALAIVLLDGWGMIGIWTNRFGFHNVWEVWLYQTLYGLFVCPWYSYSQIMISEVTPRGHEYLFFSLFSIIGKTSSFIGPFISSAIIDTSPTHDTSAPFYFLFALALVSFVFLMVSLDLKKSRIEQERFLKEEELERLKSSSSSISA